MLDEEDRSCLDQAYLLLESTNTNLVYTQSLMAGEGQGFLSEWLVIHVAGQRRKFLDPGTNSKIFPNCEFFNQTDHHNNHQTRRSNYLNLI